MRLVIQRVLESAVSVDGKEISKAGKGLLVLLGITKTDNKETVDKYANKVLKLRLWDEIPKKQEKEESTEKVEGDKEEQKNDGNGAPKKLKTWNTNVMENEGDIMVVSQFTLYGILKGNKPDFHGALSPEEAVVLYNDFVEKLKKNYAPDRIKTGQFGAYMNVHLVNDGPVTLIVDSEKDK